jgi:hypothetical protein
MISKKHKRKCLLIYTCFYHNAIILEVMYRLGQSKVLDNDNDDDDSITFRGGRFQRENRKKKQKNRIKTWK